jgi:hypothetical protein
MRRRMRISTRAVLTESVNTNQMARPMKARIVQISQNGNQRGNVRILSTIIESLKSASSLFSVDSNGFFGQGQGRGRWSATS